MDIVVESISLKPLKPYGIMDKCQIGESGNLEEVVAINAVCVLWKTVQIDVH